MNDKRGRKYDRKMTNLRYGGKKVNLQRSEHQFFMCQINENDVNNLRVLHVFVKFCPLKLFRIISHFSRGYLPYRK